MGRWSCSEKGRWPTKGGGGGRNRAVVFQGRCCWAKQGSGRAREVVEGPGSKNVEIEEKAVVANNDGQSTGYDWDEKTGLTWKMGPMPLLRPLALYVGRRPLNRVWLIWNPTGRGHDQERPR